jgi:hypothetical protein
MVNGPDDVYVEREGPTAMVRGFKFAQRQIGSWTPKPPR